MCCAVVLLVFCGPGLRPCRHWRGSSRRPRKAQRQAQRSPTPKRCSCVVLLCCWSGVRVARQQQQVPPQQHPGRRRGERSEAPPQRDAHVLCCCVVVFCGPGLRPCRRWRGSSRRPRKAQRRCLLWARPSAVPSLAWQQQETPEGAEASAAKPHLQRRASLAYFFFVLCAIYY